MNQETRDDILRSWKEIAVYLGCDVRTCQRWAEGSGLPVFKLGTGRGRVHAKKDELDRWIAEKSDNNKSPKAVVNASKTEPATAPRTRKRLVLPAVAVLGIALIVVLFFGFKKRAAPGNADWPHDFRIDGSTLIIVDQKDRPLWTYDTGFADLMDEKRYRDHFQIQTNFCEGSTCLPRIMIRDIQGDSIPEVLFSVFTRGETHDGTLYCFDNRGTLLWRFEAGHPVVYGSDPFPKEFSTRGFEAADLNRDGRMEFVVISSAFNRFPTQIALIDSKGKLQAEYWNSGSISDIGFLDYDKDGRIEIILAGLNNEYKKGVLVVLDPESIKGGSPQMSETFRQRGLEPGSEEFYILFPYHEIDFLLGPLASIDTMQVLESILRPIRDFVFDEFSNGIAQRYANARLRDGLSQLACRRKNPHAFPEGTD
jgi:hypothetical protein